MDTTENAPSVKPAIAIRTDVNLETFRLGSGGHNAPRGGKPEGKGDACVMELAAYLAGEPWSDTPQCACPALTRALQRLNDRWGDEERQLLKPYAVRVIGTRSTDEVAWRRAWVLLDHAIRRTLPRALDELNMAQLATELRESPAIVDRPSAKASSRLALKVRDALRVYRDEMWAKYHAAATAAAAAAAAAVGAAARGSQAWREAYWSAYWRLRAERRSKARESYMRGTLEALDAAFEVT